MAPTLLEDLCKKGKGLLQHAEVAQGVAGVRPVYPTYNTGLILITLV